MPAIFSEIIYELDSAVREISGKIGHIIRTLNLFVSVQSRPQHTCAVQTGNEQKKTPTLVQSGSTLKYNSNHTRRLVPVMVVTVEKLN